MLSMLEHRSFCKVQNLVMVLLDIGSGVLVTHGGMTHDPHCLDNCKEFGGYSPELFLNVKGVSDQM